MYGFLIGIAVFFGTLAYASTAEAYLCSRPIQPDVPDGNSSNVSEMKNAEYEINSYLSEITEYVDCLSREAQDAASEGEQLRDNWNNEVSEFNGN
jgi:hypothetical protein